MADGFGSQEVSGLTEGRLRQHALELPGTDEVVRVEGSLIVAVCLDADRRATQRIQCMDEIELFLREALLGHGGLARLKLDYRLRLDLSERLWGQGRGGGA